MAELMAANGITDPDHIEVGQELNIPPPTPATTTVADRGVAPPRRPTTALSRLDRAGLVW